MNKNSGPIVKPGVIAKIFGDNEITIVNYLDRKVIIAVSSDPNSTKMMSANGGVGIGADGVNGNVSFGWQFKSSVVSFKSIAPESYTVVKVDSSKAYVTAAAESSSGGYYVLFVSRLMQKQERLGIIQKQLDNYLVKVKKFPG